MLVVWGMEEVMESEVGSRGSPKDRESEDRDGK